MRRATIDVYKRQPLDDYRDEVDEIYNRVDNINIRLRKVESYLGFRPDNTI